MRFDRDPSSLDRRTFFKGVGASVASAALFGGTAAAAENYSNVVDIVEAGADSSGAEPINGVLQDHLENDTLIEFPNGRYLLDQQSLYGLQNFGMRAVGDDVTLVPAGQHSEYWISGWGVQNFLFEGFTVDETESGIHPEIAFGATDGLVVRDIERVGYHDGNNQSFGFRITESDGSGLIENVRLPDGGEKAVGIYTDTTGTLTFRDCRIEGFGDNGLYASRSTGPVQVEGGTYKNNDTSQVRLGSDGSYVKNATIVVNDPPQHQMPRNARGVRVSDGPDEGRVTVDSCDIVVKNAVGGGGVVSAYNGGAFTVTDTNIEVGRDYTSVHSGGERTSNAILADKQSAGSTGECRVENTSITGEGVNLSAIWFRGRDSTAVENSCIQQSGTSRSGVIYEGCGDNTVVDTTINVPEEAIVERDCAVSTSGISRSGSCPAPNASEPSGEPTDVTATTSSTEEEDEKAAQSTDSPETTETASTDAAAPSSSGSEEESSDASSTSTSAATESETSSSSDAAASSGSSSADSSSADDSTASDAGSDDASDSNSESSPSSPVPLPSNANGLTYPTIGTDADSPTLTVYLNFRCPYSRKFVLTNLRTLVEEYVRSGDLNVQFRSVVYNLKDADQPYITSTGDRLAQLALGAWDYDPASYWSFLTSAFENQSTLDWETDAEAKALLEANGVANAGRITARTNAGAYRPELENSYRAGKDAGLHFVPMIELSGDLAAANVGSEQLRSWVEDRL